MTGEVSEDMVNEVVAENRRLKRQLQKAHAVLERIIGRCMNATDMSEAEAARVDVIISMAQKGLPVPIKRPPACVRLAGICATGRRQVASKEDS